MSSFVLHTYDQAALDGQYDNRSKVSKELFAAFSARCERGSEAARRDWPRQLDVAYGPGPAERLDIFFTDSHRLRPTQIFFHGGYWRANDKKDFNYVANGLLPRDINLVVVEYGLIPRVTMDELVAQCRSAVAWTFRNIARCGGDPDRLFISGHSAGAHIVAMMLLTDWHSYADDLPINLIKGAAAISGIYDLEPIRLCFLNSSLNLEPADVARNSPINFKPLHPTPLLLALGDREGDEYLRQSSDFAAAWGNSKCAPELFVLKDLDHYSIREQLGNPGSELISLITRRMKIDVHSLSGH